MSHPMMAFFDLATTPGQPWKNGAGSTQELACWPPGAGMDHFAWRLSVATIARSGPFSVFPGVQRQIMLLGGDGVHLRHARGRWEHLLDQRWQPFAFDGDEPLECRLAGGPSTALNLMLRHGLCSGTLQVLRSAPAPETPAAGLCMVLQGLWQWRGSSSSSGDGDTARALKAGQGFGWMDQRIESPGLASAAQHAGAALAWVALTGVPSPAAAVRAPSDGRAALVCRPGAGEKT
ncbi:HutD/Ves family protein [Verminephrobacter eiseniae]|uniref:HutD/Ves family protein n=2 Tax=Verminephrobacter eiseniae TaxID=364317 RepID=UPI0022449B8D|nr:HutD family protein [Verminephrobacter eiseniae]MCW5284891.1 HutD family protein [Verminephrobacter eiseniae]MCW5302599.1 HutD family protein [Verminephrobacter eiseniae]MCW8180875.1 HutD family protein [Verminephrobacter eiseniae]MCW8192691.1 HutD family protein [Verminephrobacter eiseniae]